MNEKNAFALVRMPPSALEKGEPRTKSILSGMVAETLALAHKDQAVPPAGLFPGTFRIADYYWYEPDYRQILLWAKALRTDPESVVKRLTGAHASTRLQAAIFGDEWQEGFWRQGGRLINITLENWDVEKFEWIEDLQLTNLEIIFYSREPSTRNPPHKVESLSFPLPRLTSLSCSHISAAEIDLSSLTNLKRLQLQSTVWQKLILPKTDGVTSFSCSFHRTIDMGFFLRRFPRLSELECSHNQIDTLDPLNLPELLRLSCRKNKLRRLNLQAVPKLTKLDCDQNQIAQLDLSKVHNLTELDCSGNSLSELDIRQLHRLEILKYDSARTRLIQSADQHF